MFTHTLVLIKGAGDLASGVAVRLFRAGFPIVMTELETPLAVRRTVAFAEAVYSRTAHVEEIMGRLCTPAEVASLLQTRDGLRQVIPVIVDPAATSVVRWQPHVVVDGIMAKRNSGTARADAPLVIALGPGFHAGMDCHAVIETNRGHDLGRVIWQGAAAADTGVPGWLPGMPPVLSRVLRAPAAGHMIDAVAIGSHVGEGEAVGRMRGDDGRTYLIHAPFAGVLRGMIHPRVALRAGMKIGDLDPRIQPHHCYTVSDKSLAIGGGVLEAILTLMGQSDCRSDRPVSSPLTQ